MQGLLHQPFSLGDEWLQRLAQPSTQRELFQETSAMEEMVQQLIQWEQVISPCLGRVRL